MDKTRLYPYFMGLENHLSVDQGYPKNPDKLISQGFFEVSLVSDWLGLFVIRSAFAKYFDPLCEVSYAHRCRRPTVDRFPP